MANEDIVLEIIAQTLGRKSVNTGCTIDFLDLNRYDNAQKLAQILNEEFGLLLTCRWIQKAKNLKEIVSFVTENGNLREDTPFVKEVKSEGIFDILVRDLKRFDNNYDRRVVPLPDHILSKVRREHRLENNINVYYYRENDSETTFIITDQGISYCDTGAKILEQYAWGKIDRVEYSPSENYFFIYFSENSDVYDSYSRYTLVKGLNDDESRYFAKVLTNTAENFENEEDNLFEELNTFMEKGNLEEALVIVEKLLNLNSENLPFYHFAKGRILAEILNTQEVPDNNLIEQAQKNISIARETMDEETLDEFDSSMHETEGILHRICGEFYLARNSFACAMEAKDRDIREEAEEYYLEAEEALKETWENYTERYDYKDRKFIMPVKNISGCIVPDIDVFRMNNIPPCFSFPAGHPVANELYMGHPYNPSVYIPYEGSEYAFFLDKIDELCYLLQCLGATEISITAIKGKAVNELTNSSIHIDGDANVKMFSGGAEYNNKFGSEKDSCSKSSLALTQRFDPMKLPYLPEDLVWYPEQTNWQRLVQQRINGNMLEYHQTISTSETKFVSSTEENDLKASAKFLWTKVNATYKDALETKFKQSMETEWRIDVKFRSILDFDKFAKNGDNVEQEVKNVACLTDEEEKYKEEVLFCLEEGGVISDEERSFLERKRKKLGVSEDRAKEIENVCLDELMTAEEREYIEELQAAMIDGVIPDNVRRLLDRLRKSLDITETRAKELELGLMK